MMTPEISVHHTPPARRRRFGTGIPGNAGRSALAWLRAYAERARQRHALTQLDARLLRDVGLTPDDVEGETGKPLWRP